MGLYTWSHRITSRFIGWCTFGAVPDETHQYTSHMKPMLATEPYVRDLVCGSSPALICECSHLITHIIYFLINPEYNLKVYLHALFSFFIWCWLQLSGRWSTIWSKKFPTGLTFAHFLLLNAQPSSSFLLHSGSVKSGSSDSMQVHQQSQRIDGVSVHNTFNFAPRYSHYLDTPYSFLSFDSSARLLPLQVHIQSLSIPHFPSLMIAMAKPA